MVGAGVEGTVKRHESSMNKIYGKDLRASTGMGSLPVGGTVVGVVSGLGAASLGVTEHRITERRIM